MMELHNPPRHGEGDRPQGGGGGRPHNATLNPADSPHRQPLRVCHLPVPGRIFA